MKTLIKKKTTFSNTDNLILLCNLKNKLSKFKLSKKEIDYVKKEQQDKKEVITINQYERWVFIITPAVLLNRLDNLFTFAKKI